MPDHNKMNKLYPLPVFALLIMSSCNYSSKSSNNNLASKLRGDSVSLVAKKADLAKKSKEANSASDNDSLKYLLGVWNLIGSNNPTFEIKKSSFYYPEHFKSYQYKIIKDSVKIYYEDFNESFAFGFKGKDTLTLKGEDGLSVYYRTKE